MAQVPLQDAPSVAAQELPGVQLRAPYRLLQMADLGPGQQIRAGQALEQAGSSLGHEQALVQAQQNEAAVKAAEANATQMATSIMWDPDTGVMAQRGQNAVDAAPKAVQALQDARTGLAEGLTNPVQRQMFQQVSDAQHAAEQRQIAQHVAAQSFVAEQDASKLRVQTHSDAAVQSYQPGGDNSTFALHIAAAQNELEGQAKAAGIPDEAVGQYVKDGMAPTYTALVNHLIDQPGGTGPAAAALAQIRDQLPTSIADTLQKKVEAGQSADKVVSTADQIGDTVQGIDAQLAEARKRFESGQIDGKEREQVESRLMQVDRRSEEQSNKATASAVGQAQDWLLKNPGKGMLDMLQDPSMRSTYFALEAKGHLAALDAFANRENNKSDPAVYHNVVAHMGDGGPQDPMKLPDADWLLLHNNGLGDADWKRFDKERTDMQNGTIPSKLDPGRVDTPTLRASLNDRLKQLGIDTNPKDDAGKAQVGGIQRFAMQYVLQDQAAAGHKFNAAEMEKSLDTMFSRGAVAEHWYGDEQKKLVQLSIDDVPATTRTQIRAGLMRAGNAAPSDQDVLNTYRGILARRQ